MPRSIHFGVFMLGTGNHTAGWRYPGADQTFLDIKVQQRVAATAERGLFDFLFLGDGLAANLRNHPSYTCRLEPLTLLSALAMTTTHIGLAATMSRYLIDRIKAAPNIEVLTRTDIVALSGTPEARLERVRWRNNETGEEVEKRIRNVFLFVGADPATKWLEGCGVIRDGHGFVRTGSSLAPDDCQTDHSSDKPRPLECNIHGVFAVGDVRSGSVKRVGAAIGEGAAVVAQVHQFLARTAQPEAGQATVGVSLPDVSVVGSGPAA